MFSGFAGIKSTSSAFSNSQFNPQASLDGFFAGQIDFAKLFIFRAEFSFQTDNILNSSIFEGTNATFCLDEVSATYIFPTGLSSNYLSLFMGTYEPIGSDIFLQRQFGIQPITSLITENWLGLNGSEVYPFYGFGISYIIHMAKEPFAFGTYAYINENDSNLYVLNGNLRFACVYDNFCLDTAFGIGAPLGTETDTDNVIVVIKKLYGNAGINLLVGNKYTTSVFFQGGFSDILITRSDSLLQFSPDTTYFLLEPRFCFGTNHLDISVFSFPEDVASSLMFIEDQLGFNISIYKEQNRLGSKVYTAGLHTTISFPDKDLLDLNATFINNLKLRLCFSPFVSFQMGTGKFNALLKFDGLNLISNPSEALEFDFGYKEQL